jgi:hypothetical protein
MKDGRKTSWVLNALSFTFLALAAAFVFKVWGRPTTPYPIPLVDASFLDTATARESYGELVRKKADLSDFDCYAVTSGASRRRFATTRITASSFRRSTRTSSWAMVARSKQQLLSIATNENNLELFRRAMGGN